MRNVRGRPLVLLSSVLTLLAVACGGSGDTAAPSSATTPAAGQSDTASGQTAAGAEEEVLVENIAFKPPSIEVAAGTTVVWTNQDEAVRHTVTSGLPGDTGVPGVREPKPNEPDGRFNGDLPDAGDTFSFTFDEPGTYPYFCIVHPSMTAEVVVT
jgi:plastocyanin